MPPSYFPLRWESTGDQWWYASPIDWAAANGLYDVVRELLHIDTNLLVKLTSLRRIRRLETVWDDDNQFGDVAKCRSDVARKLLLESETNKGHNSLIRAGYGGWLLYTAASAGDVDFAMDLLQRDPLLVFGEGEYGVTDMFYAVARSKNSEVFKLLLDFAFSSKVCLEDGDPTRLHPDEKSSVFKREMMNRVIHAAARGGNLDMLKELLGDCSDVLVYTDAQGSTILHTAAGRGQVEVVEHLIASFDIITSTDNQGNTALHVAAYRGYLTVVEALILACPSMSSMTNSIGDTFLHMAVAGFRTPGFRRVDWQMELMKQLLSGKHVNVQDIINVRNVHGRTALHMAVSENIQSNVVELLMTVPSIDLNIRDANGMTPLDLLKQRPRSVSSKILIKQLISAGGISNSQDYETRSALVSHLRVQGIGNSPGTSFRIPDAEIFLFTGLEITSDANYNLPSPEYTSCLSEHSESDSVISLDDKRSGSISHAARRLKFLLRWPRRKERKSLGVELRDDDSLKSVSIHRNLEGSPIPLRLKYSPSFSLLKSKTLSPGGFPSPSAKRKFAAGLMHGVIQASPGVAVPVHSPSSPFPKSSMSSPGSVDMMKAFDISGPSCSSMSFDGKETMNYKQTSLNKKLMNQYFCFGTQGLAMEDSFGYRQSHLSHRPVSSLVA